jgi:Secretion system C-terminal sorting domain
LELTFRGVNGFKTVKVDNTVNNQDFVVRLDFRPDTVLVDPALRIISKDNTTQQLPDVNDGSTIVKPTNNGQGGVDVNPNPVTGPLTIYLHDFDAPNASIIIYNAAGQRIFTKNVALWYGTANVNLANLNLAKGMYIVEATAGDAKATKQFVR